MIVFQMLISIYIFLYGHFLGMRVVILGLIVTALILIYILFELEKAHKLIYEQQESIDHFGVLDEEKRKSLEHIKEIKRLYTSGNKELLFKYIEDSQRGYYDEALLSFDLEILNIILQRYLYICKSNDIEMKYDIQTNVKTLLEAANLTGEQLCTVLGNLMDNAVDALKHYEGKRLLSVKIYGNGHQVIVEVKNTGKPIESSVMEKLFNYGFSTKAQGRGAGLFIVYKLLEKLGARLSVESNKQDTCFKVVFNLS